MAFLGSLFGGGGPSIERANLLQPVTQEQAAAGQAANLEQMQQQQALLQALQGQGGLGKQVDVYGQQQALANQLQQQALGQGPNPALAQLANTTGQNMAQQAALMAGQRGAGANAGLLARQAAMQGGALQQQSAGQAAALAAQQQLAAQQALQQQQQLMGGMATQLAGQQIGQQNINQAAAAQNQQSLFGQANAQNQAQLQQAQMINQANAEHAKTQGNVFGGLLGAAGTALAGPLGGMVSGGLSSLGSNVMSGIKNAFMPQTVAEKARVGSDGQGASMMGPNRAFAQGGMVEGMECGGKVKGPKSKVGQHFKQGGMVPGKAKHAGDHNGNDTVPAMLSPGEIVIPRSIVNGKDAPKKAAEFVAAVMRKNGLK